MITRITIKPKYQEIVLVFSVDKCERLNKVYYTVSAHYKDGSKCWDARYDKDYETEKQFNESIKRYKKKQVG
jgi:hypothetical protein